MTGGQEQRPVPLDRWLWRSYLRSAIIPLLVIELSFLAIYWASGLIVHRENVAALSKVSRDYINDVARREALSISKSYADIAQTTNLFANQSKLALQGNYDPPASEKSRYAMSASGAFYTRSDNGTTASFYSGVRPIGPEEIRKVWKLSALDPLMIDITRNNPEIASVYFNSFDSYNRIYPYFKVLEQYPVKMDIPSYNFYYEADGKHNPSRKPAWTDAYIDPAGQGWMVSSIAPVWIGNRLEGVVGIDITLNAIIDQLNGLDLPWGGYAVLVDRNGRILALPPAGEQDFGLKELTDHHYSEAIMADTLKPDAFNIMKRADTKPLAQAMAKADEGEVTLQFDGPHKASFARIAGPDWRLVVIAPAKNIYSSANTLRNRLETVGYVMLAGLMLFYVIFFILLYRRAQAMSTRVAAPLGVITGLIERIGRGQFRQDFSGSQVEELDQLGRHLVHTGEQLGDAHDRIVEQERLVSRALLRQRQLYEEQARFVGVMSHELRTPLSVIDSGAQVIDRKADEIEPAELRKRVSKMRGAVQRISDLLKKLVASLSVEDDPAALAPRPAELDTLVNGLARDIVPAARLRLTLSGQPAEVSDGPSLTVALRAIIDNAMRYAPEGTPIEVTVATQGGLAFLLVADQGPGIPPEELPLVGERFFRGTNATGMQGAGIGLYLARHTLETMGGNLAIESASTGTRVTCTVPLTPPAARATPPQAEEIA